MLAFTFKIELTISCCNAGCGEGPSLGCAVQEEHGHPKGEKLSFFAVELTLFPGHACPEAKGTKRLYLQQLMS